MCMCWGGGGKFRRRRDGKKKKLESVDLQVFLVCFVEGGRKGREGLIFLGGGD